MMSLRKRLQKDVFMKGKTISLLIIAIVFVFVCTCFAVAFAIGRKEKVESAYVVSSGDQTAGVATTINDKLGFVNVEWIIQEKDTTENETTYTATVTATFTPGKAAIKAGGNYGKWKCKSGYLHVTPVCNNASINFVAASPLSLDNDAMIFSSQKGADNPKTYQWSFKYNEKSDEIYVLPVTYKFSIDRNIDVSEISLRIDLKMAVTRGFSNRAFVNSFYTSNL